ncbi:hypothetical protein BDN70DRAFT_895954 [Pholiota conissans]|uniref:BTB domain-containing protein n=1 Tax=Pholiota conissans TaxID=109636 RepID=A0A9P5YZ04_9AGAR|nr:hypothetical protein BDN70DRAFT_895954 [Pholiota conissans]
MTPMTRKTPTVLSSLREFLVANDWPVPKDDGEVLGLLQSFRAYTHVYHDSIQPKVLQHPNIRHSRFYFPDGNIIFLLDNVLFKVHRYFFQRDSPVFSAMFTLPHPERDTAEGEMDEKPVKLTGFTPTDFERFLTLLYPKDFTKTELTGTEAWISVLKIATQFEFASLRALAITRIRNFLVNAPERIAVAKQYGIDNWLVQAYTDLCTRDEPLTLEEGRKVGLEDVIDLYRVRALIRYSSNLNRHHDTIRALVCKEFHLTSASGKEEAEDADI